MVWQVGSPETVKAYSAVGYHFARKIRDELGVPVGLICTACNGVRIQTFIPRATLETLPDGKLDIDKTDRLIRNWTPEAAHNEYELVTAKFEKELAAFSLPADQQKPENRPMSRANRRLSRARTRSAPAACTTGESRR